MVNAQRGIVGEDHSMLNAIRSDIPGSQVGAPGGTLVQRLVRDDVVDEAIRRNEIVVLSVVHMPTGLELLEIIQAGSGQCVALGPR